MLRAALGWLVHACSPKYAARLRANLYGSGVCSGEAQCDALRRKAIAEAGKGMLELLAVWFGSDEKVARLAVACEGWEVVEAARARGKGIIIVTPQSLKAGSSGSSATVIENEESGL